ncbi:MAG: AMP-binding protein [Ilumatobacter sp.]|uniref:AMP-binding protein n=1 Tax=Ilumatobacter sp. TaxID=1967498 RepID=UPI00260B3C5A|nr:AMP-binding protein [Ilumatobacter sp.]MDJ0768399.1 AMP-binding protein [Ilumatobacter sp.]
MTASGWNLADVFERIADRIPDALAQQQGTRSFTWREFDQRADGVAAALLDAGLTEQNKVAQYLFNAPEYLESVFGAFKAGMAVVNTNYRYAEDELVYLWDNADVVAVVFHGEFVETIEHIRARVPRVRLWLWVDDASGPCPDWATPYEAAATSNPGRTHGPWGRSGDHLLLLYTGGTTGMPKGVMWRQDDVFGALDTNNRRRMPPEQDLEAIGGRVDRAGPRGMPGAPLMHGTGLFNALSTLMVGGSITTVVGRHFDAAELLDTIEQQRINSISIVGDAFAKPLLAALDAEPHRWDVSSLRVIVSSGVMWSKESKAGLLRHNDRLIMVDSLGSSEAIGMATNTTTAATDTETAKFELSPTTRVVTDDGRDVTPGTGELGRVALRGYTPIGYYKDPDKSAATFQVIDGQRYSIPGDWAEVLADGTVKLLGRGSQCINTGGEKVYPEEVEECLKLHPDVADAAVVGVPDDRFGEAIHAVVEPQPGATVVTGALIDHVKARLARYKAPKAIHVVESLGRAVNGKLDYKAMKAIAMDRSSPSGV